MAVSAAGAGTGFVSGAAAGSSFGIVGTVVGGIIGAIAGLFSGGEGPSRSSKLAGYAQAALAIKQQELVTALKPYAIQEAEQAVKTEEVKTQAAKDKELMDIFSTGIITGAQTQAQASQPFDWTPVLIGGGVIGAFFVYKKWGKA